ncbi:MAG: transporter [Paenibacillaceae bacterium]|nr:transporter [Paenibacillaceae bacterium]
MSTRAKSRLMPPLPAGFPKDEGVNAGKFAGNGQQEGQGPPRVKTPLSSQTWLLLAVHGLFTAGNALSGTFVHVYLWKAAHNFALLGWFSAVQQVSMAITFWLMGKWVKEHNKMNALRAGVLISAGFYAIVLLLGETAADMVWLLGLVHGLGSGLFWLAFNVVYFEVTDPDSRDRFNGVAGILGSGSGMLAPWISGLLISRMTHETGYRLIFTLSLAVFVLGGIASFFLAKRKGEGSYDWTFTPKYLRRRDGIWNKMFFAMLAQGIREGVFGFLIGILVYISTGNEYSLGNFALITSAAGLLSFYVAGRFYKPRHRLRGMLLAVLGLTLVILPFFWKVEYATLLIFGIGTAMFIPFYTVPVTSTSFDLIGRDPDCVSRREEFVVLRELGLNVGRLLGTLAFLLTVSFSATTLSINVLMLAIGSSPLLVWVLMRRFLKTPEAGSSTG